jgi:hypothetical protein
MSRSAERWADITDAVVADPYKDIAERMELAFYVGQSGIVGGTKTDIVAYAGDGVFVQVWIGAEDRLPPDGARGVPEGPAPAPASGGVLQLAARRRRPRRHFASARAARAKPIPFAHPDPGPPAAAPEPPRTK